MDPDFFNVFLAQYEPMTVDYFAGSGAEGRVLYESADRRHLCIATRYPLGIQFRYGGSVSYKEVFYVISGRGRRTYADGSSVAMTAGDLIYVRPGIDIDYVYEPGFADVAFFWTEVDPLPAEISAGIRRKGISQ